MSDYEAMTDDELLALGADAENSLSRLKAELRQLEADLIAARRDLRTPAIKLGLNTGLGGAGIVFAGLGWSGSRPRLSG